MEKKTENMLIAPVKLSKDELMARAYKQKWRELKIARIKAEIIRKKTVEAYEILDSIRFDYLGDSMFRDHYMSAKRGLEAAISDFLLSETYHEKRINEHKQSTPEEYDVKVKQNAVGTQGAPGEKK